MQQVPRRLVREPRGRFLVPALQPGYLLGRSGQGGLLGRPIIHFRSQLVLSMLTLSWSRVCSQPCAVGTVAPEFNSTSCSYAPPSLVSLL